ncbi:hypothetical protein ACMATS_32585 [Streptoverticillium reticulum]|uniref:hypothetical protein n=1 Tax=Streptoverticillium reticulum TaxID=1433415 RepID=UPI0039BEF5AE
MHVRPRRVVFATLAASSLLLLSACDGGSASADKKDNKGAPSAPSVPASLSAEQAEQALVAPGDLPAGWKLEANTGLDKSQGADDDMVTGAKPLCAPVTAVLNSGRLEADYKANAQEVFTKKGDRTTVAQDVSGYPRAQAERAMTGLRTAVEQCGTFTGKQAGKKATVTVKKTAEQPKYGDDSLRYTVKVVQGDLQMDFDMGTVRSHGAITTVLNNYPDHGDRGMEAFTKALSKAAEKLGAAAAKTA